MYTAAVITVSDRGASGLREDASGPLVAALLEDAGYRVVRREIIPDVQQVIEETLLRCADEAGISLIVTTGGSGFSPRDLTPEATVAVCERLAPGIAEAMRAASLLKTPRAMLSRAQAGLRGRSLILNLPGSPRGARENLLAVLPALAHGLAVLLGSAGECAARVLSVNVSEEKGRRKRAVPLGELRVDHGLAGDAHAGPGPRQLSLLAQESADKMRGQIPDLTAGAFGENIVTAGLPLFSLPLGTQLKIGETAVCELTQIGKLCHDTGCAIRQTAGDCIMPREGVFARVLAGGIIRPGDEIALCGP